MNVTSYEQGTKAARSDRGAASGEGVRRYRPELQGLRALAAVLVVVYHVWLGRISGGVDVFFLVSGFLITGQLVRASLRGGIQYRPMWGRMIKRLLPAALTVLLATMAGALLFLPEHRWLSTAREVVASALYFENWQLAADSADYFAQHNAASVAQHFWSLSIQGQFYLVWPLLIGLVALVARRVRVGLRRSVFVTLAIVGAASLAYSVWLTAVDQPFAYFSSLTRIWEFALGGLLALVIDAVVLPRALRVVLGWVGVAGLVSCGLVLTVGTVFPGYVALWPTLSAAFVLLAGATGSAVGADRLLSSRPFIYAGNISFALYLWHWPVLLYYLLARDQAEVGPRGGAAVIAASFALAVLTYHLVEEPVRRSDIGVVTRWGAYRFAAASLVVVVGAAVGWQVVSHQRASFTFDVADQAHPGAQVLRAGGPTLNKDQDVLPPYAALPDEYVTFTEEECERSARSDDVRICAVDPPRPPERRIVVAGDSHSQQYLATLMPLVEKRNWQVISVGKAGCPLTTNPTAEPTCKAWNEIIVDEIARLEPDLVVTMGTRDVRVGLTEYTPRGYVDQWRKFDELGIPVMAMRDSPRYDFEPSTCVQKHGMDAPRCTSRRADVYPPQAPFFSTPNVPPNVTLVDFSDSFCTAEKCPPVIGNVLVYLDDNHVTKTYFETLSPRMEEETAKLLGL